MVCSHKIEVNIRSSSSSSKLEECRICHDEDEDSNMDTPCSCRGSLKYAHRKCVQRWCNEKGDIICEICQQQFKPGYTALFHYGGNLRRDLHNHHTEFDDDSPTNLICSRMVAIIFTVLLVLRHTLPIIISGAGDYSMTLFTLLMLRSIVILLHIYIMVRACIAIQHGRHQEGSHIPLAPLDQGNDLPHHQPRFVHIR
ncbi:hypothetical protein UlMin_015062 [Ulmus minor]